MCRLGLCMREVFQRTYTAACCSAGRDLTTKVGEIGVAKEAGDGAQVSKKQSIPGKWGVGQRARTDDATMIDEDH